MIRVRAISGLIAAAAVLVVSATCTPAACLLPMGTPHHAQPKARSCCEESDQPVTPAHHVPQDERCPMCQNPVLMGSNVDPGHSFNAAALAVTIFCSVWIAPVPASALTEVGPASDRRPPLCPVSLLALHCALLT